MLEFETGRNRLHSLEISLLEEAVVMSRDIRNEGMKSVKDDNGKMFHNSI